MTKFLLWLLLLVFCWPIALLALVLYPIVWIVLLPFRLVGIAFEGLFQLLRTLLLLPARVLGGSKKLSPSWQRSPPRPTPWSPPNTQASRSRK
jgi:hypothetical protein